MIYLVKYIIQKIMFKVKKVVSVLLLMVMILCFNHAMVFASTKTVTAVAEMVGRDIVISGKVNGANESNKVLLLVGSLENVLYINEANTSAKGEFSFKFRLPYDSPSGTYSYSIGNNGAQNIY